jgi:hypothetical protein
MYPLVSSILGSGIGRSFLAGVWKLDVGGWRLEEKLPYGPVEAGREVGG